MIDALAREVMLFARAQPARWSASAWFVSCRGTATGGPMLGDQACLRVAYHPGSGQPTAAPVRIIAEYRAGLDGTPDGPALGMIAGVYSVLLPLDLSLEAYGQAGAVAHAPRRVRRWRASCYPRSGEGQ